jgi:hypothetical protein
MLILLSVWRADGLVRALRQLGTDLENLLLLLVLIALVSAAILTAGWLGKAIWGLLADMKARTHLHDAPPARQK